MRDFLAMFSLIITLIVVMVRVFLFLAKLLFRVGAYALDYFIIFATIIFYFHPWLLSHLHTPVGCYIIDAIVLAALCIGYTRIMIALSEFVPIIFMIINYAIVFIGVQTVFPAVFNVGIVAPLTFLQMPIQEFNNIVFDPNPTLHMLYKNLLFIVIAIPVCIKRMAFLSDGFVDTVTDAWDF